MEKPINIYVDLSKKEIRRVNIDYDTQLYREGFAAIGKTFRGEIWENCDRFQLKGSGYSSMPPEQDGHFWISSARHLTGPLRALRDPNVRKVFVIGATQVLKSVLGDIWTPYCIEHVRRPMLILFEDDPKAKIFCDARLMETIRGHPANWVANVDRHDATKTKIKLNGVLVQVCGMNEGNVSSLSWPLIWISEAWQHKRDGLLRKAIKRADRFPNDCKILVESQAGEEGEDLHTEAKGAHQVPLTWACPLCGVLASWECDAEYSQTREDGSFAGMIFDEGEDIDARARSARWECFHCRGQIADTKENRLKIEASYEQVYKVNGVSPKEVCFVIPREAHVGNSFESGVANYLKAKEAQRHGNDTPLKDWFMSERARFYGPKLIQKATAIITESRGDPAKQIPNEAARTLAIDCQQGPEQNKTGHFWYEARAIDKPGKNFPQIARGYAESWQEWRDVQKALVIPNANVAIDGRRYTGEIVDMAARCWEWGTWTDPRTGRVFRARKVWKIMIGNGVKKSFPHGTGPQRVWRNFSEPNYFERTIEDREHPGKFITLRIEAFNWSNLSVKDHLQNLLSGGEGLPKFTALKREDLNERTRNKEFGDLAYAKQMANEYRDSKNGRDFWAEATPNVHYRDVACESIVMMDMGGYLGLPAAASEQTDER